METQKKIITSPVAAFPGTITLIDRPTLHVVGLWTNAKLVASSEPSEMASRAQKLGAALLFTESWQIKGQPEAPTPETFNCIPYQDAFDLLGWLYGEIKHFLDGELDIPKDFAPPATPTPEPEATSLPS